MGKVVGCGLWDVGWAVTGTEGVSVGTALGCGLLDSRWKHKLSSPIFARHSLIYPTVLWRSQPDRKMFIHRHPVRK